MATAVSEGDEAVLAEVLRASRRIGKLFAGASGDDPIAVQNEACRILAHAADAQVAAARSMSADGWAHYVAGWSSTPMLRGAQAPLKLQTDLAFEEPILLRFPTEMPVIDIDPEYIPRWRAMSPDSPTVLMCPWRSGSETVGYLCLVGKTDAKWTRLVVDALTLASSLIGQYQMRLWANELHAQRMALTNVVRTTARAFLNLGVEERDSGIEAAFAAVGELLGAESITLQRVGDGDLGEVLVAWGEGRRSPADSVDWSAGGPVRMSTVTGDHEVLLAPLLISGQIDFCLVASRHRSRLWRDWEAEEIGLLAEVIGSLRTKVLTEARLRATFYESPTGISLRSEQGDLLDCNRAYLDFLGVESRDSVAARPLDVVVQQQFPTGSQRAVENGRLHEVHGSEVPYLHADGSVVWGQVSIAVVEDGEAPLWITHIEDVTDRRNAQDLLQLRTLTDELTSLANRRGIMNTLDATFARFNQAEGSSERSNICAVVLLDLNGFKKVNDAQGHAAGDRLLIEVGRRLKTRVRPTDLVGRYGGDEFIVVLNGPIEGGDAVAQADRLRLCFSDPFQIGDQAVKIGASIGLAIALDDDEPASLLARADAAMYREKITTQDRPIGADRAVIDLDTLEQGRLSWWQVQDEPTAGAYGEMRSALATALANGEVEFWAQPIVHLPTSLPLGIELLARWVRPNGDVVHPDDFVPFAEASGLVIELDRRALACAQQIFHRWRSDRLLSKVGINVNISPSHLMSGLVEDVHALLPDLAQSSRLGLEIVETALATGSDDYLRVLQGLRNRGIRVIVDDFGVGHSSLSRLQDFPASNLKLDKSFVANIETSPDRFRFLQSVIRVLASAGYPVTVEGVETPEHLALVAQTSATAAQGFEIGRPGRLEAVEEAIRRMVAERSTRT